MTYVVRNAVFGLTAEDLAERDAKTERRIREQVARDIESLVHHIPQGSDLRLIYDECAQISRKGKTHDVQQG